MKSPDEVPTPLTPQQQALAHDHVRVVQRWAHRLLHRSDPRFEDAVSVGQVALQHAAARFDPAHGIPFGGFAWKHVGGKMKDFLRLESRFQAARRALDGFSVATLDPSDAFADSPQDTRDKLIELLQCAGVAGALGFASALPKTPEQSVEEAETSLALARARDALSPKLRRVIELRYDLDEAWQTIADDLGASLAAVKRWHAEAIVLLNARLRAHASPPS